MQRVCHFCFAPGHVKSACRKYTKHREDQKKALPVGFVGVDGGAGDLDWVVRGEVALDCWELQEPLGEEDVSWEEAFKSFRGGSVSTGDVLVGLVADLLGPEEDLLGYLKEREGIPAGGLYSPSDSLPNCYIPFPLTVEGVEVGGLLDTCSPYLFITEKIFSELKGRKVREPIKYKGVGGKVRVQEWGKKVSVVVPGGSTSWTAYPIAGDFGVDALVSWPLAQKLGVILEGLPKFFCSKVRVSDDKAWTEEEGKFSEKPLLDEVRERIKEGVRKALEDNARLLKNSHCKLRDCEFVVELEKGARPIFKRPYPILEAFQEAVNNCCQEWLDNGWVKLLPPDQRNNWNSPLLAVKKVSGNKWLGDIRLCMDFRWVNALTLDPAFTIPLCRKMLENVGMRIFSELDLVNAYHQVPSQQRVDAVHRVHNSREGAGCMDSPLLWNEGGSYILSESH